MLTGGVDGSDSRRLYTYFIQKHETILMAFSFVVLVLANKQTGCSR